MPKVYSLPVTHCESSSPSNLGLLLLISVNKIYDRDGQIVKLRMGIGSGQLMPRLKTTV